MFMSTSSVFLIGKGTGKRPITNSEYGPGGCQDCVSVPGLVLNRKPNLPPGTIWSIAMSSKFKKS